jgi:tetratricopeptide (TPR) repeat protein
MNELAIKAIEKAYNIDPKNYYNSNLGITYFNAGHYQKGVDFINSFDKDKNNGPAQLWLGMNYQRLGQNKKALDTFRNIKTIKTNSELPKQAALINIAILEDNKTKGLKALEDAQHIFLTQARLLSWASYYAYFGKKQTSLNMMKKAVEGGFYNVGEMQRNPFFDPIRGDKEFQEILTLAKQKHLVFEQVLEKQGL